MYDTFHIAWALAYESRVLVPVPRRLGHDGIYHPDRHALFHGPTAFGALPYFMPAFLLTGNPALGLNLVLVAGLSLSAWTLHLVVGWWTGSLLAGFAAACTLLATRWGLWEWGAMVPIYGLLHYLPVIFLLAAARTPDAWRRWLLPLVVLQGLVDLYVAVAVVVPLTLLALVRLARPAERARGRTFAAIVTASGLVLALAYGGALRVRLENPMLHRQSVWASYPRPLDLRELPSVGPTAVPGVALILVAAGAVLAAARRRAGRNDLGAAWGQGAFWTAAGVLMALGPEPRWNDVPIPFPHAFVAPVYRVLRFPARLAVPALVGLCVLAGAALAECLRGRVWDRLPRPLAQLGRIGLTACLVTAMYADYARGLGAGPAGRRSPLPAAYPLTPAMVPDPTMIASLRSDTGPLLELPVSPPGIALFVHAEAMYRSIFHGRPLLNGYASYWPAGFPARMALAERLPEPGALAALRQETGLTTVLVRLDRLGRSPRQAWLGLAEGRPRDDLRLVARNADELLFAVVASVPESGAAGTPR